MGHSRLVLLAGSHVSCASFRNRIADSVLSHDEAMKLNNKHFKRFYGADKPPVGKVFF